MQVVLLALTAASPALGQHSERLRTAAFFEQYRFAPGYVVRSMSELTIPVALEVALGRRASLVLSTGYASVDLTSADTVQLADQRVEGTLDTEMRLNLELIPGRLVTFLSGALPTGQQTVAEEELSVLVALTNDAIGFATASLGTGGSAGTGFSAAFPIGRFAVGAAATALYSLPYQPVLSQTGDLRPGSELRLRMGLEGPLAARTYLRVAGSIAARQKDQVGGVTAHGVGHRAIGYLTLEQGMGPALVSLYAFNVYRGTPQLEPTVLGAAILPRGNLLAGGVNVAVSLNPATSLTPRVEYRLSTAAPSLEEPGLLRSGAVLRAGADLRRRLGRDRALVIQGDLVRGDALQGTTFYNVTGFRSAVQLEIIP